jgi:hypothetical protein
LVIPFPLIRKCSLVKLLSVDYWKLNIFIYEGRGDLVSPHQNEKVSGGLVKLIQVGTSHVTCKSIIQAGLIIRWS